MNGIEGEKMESSDTRNLKSIAMRITDERIVCIA
jgi:hypothetical protein